MVQSTDRQILFKLAYKKMLEECFREKEKLDKIIYESENINTSVFSEEKENIGTNHNKKITKQMINEELDNIAEKSFNESLKEIVEKKEETNNSPKINDIKEDAKSDQKEIDEKDDEIFNTSLTKEFWKDAKLDKRGIELHDIIPLIKHNLKITFKEYSRDALEKLKILSKMIQQNRDATRRDIQSADYIKEIFESHIFDDKERFIEEFQKIETKLCKEIAQLKEKLKNKSAESASIQKEKEEITKKYEQVYSKLNNILK